MNNTATSRIHGVHTHDEMSAQIGSFPTLEKNPTLFKPKMSPYDQARLDLAVQSLNREKFTQDFCINKCLKLSNAKYIPFCLEKKCSMSMEEARKHLNWSN